MQLPVPGYTRILTVIGDKHATPPTPGLIPMSKASWYRGVKAGRYPKIVKIGPNMSACANSDLNELMESLRQEAEV